MLPELFRRRFGCGVTPRKFEVAERSVLSILCQESVRLYKIRSMSFWTALSMSSMSLLDALSFCNLAIIYQTVLSHCPTISGKEGLTLITDSFSSAEYDCDISSLLIEKKDELS